LLTTARLLLRRWRPDDLDPLAAMDADPEVMRYIGDGSTRDREQTATTLALMERHWDEFGYGLFATEIAATDEFVGWIGLATPRFLPEVMPTVEIGWRLARRFWGQGLATEGAAAVLRFAFVDCELDRIVSIRHVDNHASGRVMEKLGLHFDRGTTVPATGQPVVVTAMTRDEYLSSVDA
jgi:RimJ/RimL family protein N-acetyltransferase